METKCLEHVPWSPGIINAKFRKVILLYPSCIRTKIKIIIYVIINAKINTRNSKFLKYFQPASLLWWNFTCLTEVASFPSFYFVMRLWFGHRLLYFCLIQLHKTKKPVLFLYTTNIIFHKCFEYITNYEIWQLSIH